MIQHTIRGRVARLEAGLARGTRRDWQRRGMDEWPDEALHDFLCATLPGLAGRPAPITDAELAETAGIPTVEARNGR